MTKEKPSSGDEKPKFKEFNYFRRLHENFAPTKKNREDFGIIARLPTAMVFSALIFTALKVHDSGNGPARPGDRGYKSLSQEIAEKDEEYRRKHHLGPDGVMIPNGSEPKAEIIKPVRHDSHTNNTKPKKTDTQPTLKRIKKIGQ